MVPGVGVFLREPEVEIFGLQGDLFPWAEDLA